MDVNFKEKLLSVDVSHLCDSSEDVQVMCSEITPRHGNPNIQFAGEAYTINCQGDLSPVIKGLEEAPEGSVIVIQSQSKFAVAGEIFMTYAKKRGLSGIIIDGACRDSSTLKESDFPFYSRSVCPKAGSKSKVGEVQTKIECGSISIGPGDIIVGDWDGIVAFKPHLSEQLVKDATSLKEKEDKTISEIFNGLTLKGLLNFDEHYKSVQTGGGSKLKFMAE